MGDQALERSLRASEAAALLHCTSLLARVWKAISTRSLDASGSNQPWDIEACA